MASRRKLKKVMQYVTYELITEVYIKSIMMQDINLENTEQLTIDIVALQNEFLSRVNHPKAEKSHAAIKKYYQDLQAEWNQRLSEIIERINKA